MQVEVRPIHLLGRPLPKSERMKGPACRGKLRVAENRLHALGRSVQCATLTSVTDGLETPLLPELVDAKLLWLDDRTIRLQGSELIDGAFYTQTWDIKVL